MHPKVLEAYRRGERLHLIAFNYWHAADSREEAVERIAEAIERIGETGYREERFRSSLFVGRRDKWLPKDEIGRATQEFIATTYESLMNEVLGLSTTPEPSQVELIPEQVKADNWELWSRCLVWSDEHRGAERTFDEWAFLHVDEEWALSDQSAWRVLPHAQGPLSKEAVAEWHRQDEAEGRERRERAQVT